MITNDISTIDLTSYKRLFVFGCSFTNYMWPTWADLLHTEMPNAEFFNLGKSGAGSQFISSMIVEANQRYTFKESDLIIVQWSTYFREDRYVNNFWETPGNIFTQQTYDETFIRKFACIRGYIIRDLAIMTSIKYMLHSLPCATVLLSSIPVDAELELIDPNVNIDDVVDLYKDTIDSLQPAMSELLRPNGNTSVFAWVAKVHYMDPINNKTMVHDYHPTTALYYTYLKKLGFNLTEKSLDYSNETESILDTIKTRAEFEIYWPPKSPTIKIL